mmetsp:Transcript_8703/g.12880  ORF Transcript_8703/g.12880 Transcript_8703/m.12880 type:complete len:90 (-) Transcript_8703:1816-2085(-)
MSAFHLLAVHALELAALELAALTLLRTMNVYGALCGRGSLDVLCAYCVETAMHTAGKNRWSYHAVTKMVSQALKKIHSACRTAGAAAVA